MANLLDIFRTHTGERLMEKTEELTSQDRSKIQRTFTFTLPALLSVFQKNEALLLKDFQDLISFIEQADLISEGNNIIVHQLDPDQIELLENCSDLQKMDKESFQKILKISAGFIAAIITQMKKKEENAQISDLIQSLNGQGVEYDKVFIRTLVKNEDSPDLIDSSEEIALGKKNNNDDQSILGGYSGGR